MPLGWKGAWQSSFSATDCGTVGIRGEVTFQGFEGKTWYDVSAIDAQRDNSGVKFIYPASHAGEKTGCDKFPCDGSNNKPDDLQTKVTDDMDLICEIGG
jgi:hypothetical protein